MQEKNSKTHNAKTEQIGKEREKMDELTKTKLTLDGVIKKFNGFSVLEKSMISRLMN